MHSEIWHPKCKIGNVISPDPFHVRHFWRSAIQRIGFLKGVTSIPTWCKLNSVLSLLLNSNSHLGIHWIKPSNRSILLARNMHHLSMTERILSLPPVSITSTFTCVFNLQPESLQCLLQHPAGKTPIVFLASFRHLFCIFCSFYSCLFDGITSTLYLMSTFSKLVLND